MLGILANIHYLIQINTIKYHNLGCDQIEAEGLIGQCHSSFLEGFYLTKNFKLSFTLIDM